MAANSLRGFLDKCSGGYSINFLLPQLNNLCGKSVQVRLSHVRNIQPVSSKPPMAGYFFCFASPFTKCEICLIPAPLPAYNVCQWE